MLIYDQIGANSKMHMFEFSQKLMFDNAHLHVVFLSNNAEMAKKNFKLNRSVNKILKYKLLITQLKIFSPSALNL